MTASAQAIDGPQGFLHAMDSEARRRSAARSRTSATRWEILDTGITVKLYPSCAGTHPTLDAILDLRRARRLHGATTSSGSTSTSTRSSPTILIYDRPATGLEGKFSMPFCAAAAVVFGRVGIDTFDARDPDRSGA